MTIAITSGAAGVYAGLPDAASHRLLASLSAGQVYVITGLAVGEVVSVQSGESFAYALTAPSGTPAPTPTPTAVATEPVPSGSTAAQLVTWTCTGSPCDWGSSVSGRAVVWPATLGASSTRLGYTTSASVYLPADAATGMTIAITSGAAGVYAGLPDAACTGCWHRCLRARCM